MKKLSLLLTLLFLLNEQVSAQEVIHETTRDSQSGINSRLDIKALYDNPKAVFVVVPLDETKHKLTSPVGVWNNGVHCYVFNTDKTPMPEGVKFKIIYSGVTDSTHFLFQADIYHLKGKVAYINRPALNGKPGAVIQASMSENPSGVMNPKEIAFKYDETIKQWYVYNVDGTPIVKDLGMYIIVSNPGGTQGLRTRNVVTKQPEGKVAPRVIVPMTEVDLGIQKDVEFVNWNFENGLSGWTREGMAFNNQPVKVDNVSTQRVLHRMELNNNGIGGDYWKDQGYHTGYNGNFWIGTYENNPDGRSPLQTQGDVPTGTLTSAEFIITTAYCYFLIGGGSDPDRLFVDLQIKQQDGSWKTEAKRNSPRNSEEMHRVQIPLQGLQNKTARIRIVDNSNGNWGHINADHFRFTPQPLAGIILRDPVTSTTYEVDEDAPVWGIADTHAHPANYLGFGKRLIIGKVDAPLSETYSNVLCHENHTTAGNGLLNTPFIGGADVHPHMKGWPDFIDIPSFTSKTHQQQNIELLKRAWEGGLRIYCALAVNNMYLPSLLLGPGSDHSPYDDESTIINQIQEIKNIAGANTWMEIALTPKDARRIILQGKLAIVLGVEMDNFGNFKASTYNWDDNVNPANARLVTLNDANADQLLNEKLDHYYNLGIRQLTPIHYLSGLFGGAAVFRAEIAMIQFAFNNNISVASGVDKKIPYSLRDDYSMKMLLAGEDFASYLVKINNLGAMGNINALGMTSIGEKLVNKSMDRGFLLDSEHMGYTMKEALFTLAATRNYPVMSSHTDPAKLSFNWENQPVAFGGTPENRMQQFGTTNIRNLATEFTLAEEHYQKIRNSGGTVGIFMLPYYKKSYYNFVPNDCAGSTKTWAQMYLYSVDQMNGKGVALCSDRGMTDFIAPRFGPKSAYTLKDEELNSLKIVERTRQRHAQRNGVKYNRVMESFHLFWYHQPEAEGIDEKENDAWAAFAAVDANVPDQQLPDSYYIFTADRIKNYAKGMRATSDAELLKPLIFPNMILAQQAAMFALKNNLNMAVWPLYQRYPPDQQRLINEHYYTIKPAWDSWNSRYGNNEPLRRLRTGNRDWDFNTDGMAHYGMLPDFLQDLRNIGVEPGHLKYLFRSAEDYIQMWEKAQKAAGTNRAVKNPFINIR